MSDTDDQLEDELRALLERVLAVQLNGLTEEVAKLSGYVNTFSRNLPRQLKELVEANGELVGQVQEQTETLTVSIAQAGKISDQQGQRLDQILSAQTNITGLCEALPAQFKSQAESLAQELMNSIASAQNAAHQRDEKRAASLADAIAQIAQSIEEKNTAQQNRIIELERKAGFLRILSIATLAILSLTAASATTFYIVGHTAHP
ncbi:hypothetical protein [Acidocella facilis]|uniref:hypothetical protein n=1 Tax=Acidocella facilis TaxID=525 RepID=UPI00047E685D|nr:hypothetical protein [Acidocella facilis]